MPALFTSTKPAVLSLAAQSTPTVRRPQSQFEVLVRHLLYRFFHNELLASDDETKRVLQVGYFVALPTLLVAMYLFPAYHAFPPNPYPRPFWPQVSDHYFFVMYAFVVMGAATVYEWDLLFPDLLDVYVLSVLPIANRRLFQARVLAIAIFLALVLLGTNLLGTLFLPMVADLPNTGRHLLAHAIAVAISGTFAAATILAMQGILLNTIGENLFRRITPLLQGGCVMLLLAILLLFPAVSRSIQPLLTSGSPVIFCFPPFWFLGIYQRILDGPTTLPIFATLAHIAWSSLALMLLLAIATYPLAYRRRVRQIFEGARATNSSRTLSTPINAFLHGLIAKSPAQRASFYFVQQTILRLQRHRVMLAMYAGLGIALALANMLIFYITPGHIHPALLPRGIRAAVPIMAFWTVAGLSAIASTPVDRRAAWLFRVLVGRPRPGHLSGLRRWITLWSLLVTFTTAITLHALSPQSIHGPLALLTQAIIAIGISFLLPDIYLFTVRSMPLTFQRKSSITDLPLMVLRNFVLFPVFVAVIVDLEFWMQSGISHLLRVAIFFIVAHLLLRLAHRKYLEQFTVDAAPDDTEEFPQTLGLRDT
ncbi:hypothetical protein [Granulicella sp. 5B5]|uniref:hypothetical protein n=1 Tax=Granulicella sp. 5B5 TaxID=1617967 RepID=UPI0015F6170F|nr:hypothetical protein [Granulicella sp. 5B5]